MAGPDKSEVSAMFNDIAGSYDRLNHLLSLNVDKRWRKKAINALRDHQPSHLLDVATGTGDLAISALQLNPEKITGVDISEEMIAVGKQKIDKLNLNDRIELLYGDSLDLPFQDELFDAVTVAFGVRNFADPVKGLKEMQRVLKMGGMLVILEFTLPRTKFLRSLYRFYFHKILPLIGRLVSKNISAYRYLPDSVEYFDKGSAFLDLMHQAGFSKTNYQSLTLGVCGLYVGYKK